MELGKIYIHKYIDAHTLVANGFEVVAVIPNNRKSQKLVFIFTKTKELYEFALKNNIIKEGRVDDKKRKIGDTREVSKT